MTKFVASVPPHRPALIPMKNLRYVLPLSILLLITAITAWAQPANDAFANRFSLGANYQTSTSGSNVGATKESGEPATTGGRTSGASVWWTWTAPASGNVVINTIGSSFDTLLGVYTGTAVNALTSIAENDNASVSTAQSQVSFNAVAGTVYQIQVSGRVRFGTATGSIYLSLSMPGFLPTVTITSPANNANYILTDTVPLAATASVSSGSIELVEWVVVWNNTNSQVLSLVSNAPYTFNWTNPIAGDISVYAVALADIGTYTVSTPVLIHVTDPAYVRTTLVPTNSVWKYLDNGSDQGTAWIAPTFDDSTWASGPAPLGYGDSNGRAVLTTTGFGADSNNKYPTTYFRRSIVVTNIASYTNLFFYIQRDDGAIVYLNGVQIGRFNMPETGVSYLSFSSANAADDGTTTFTGVASPALLVEGTNVLAVEIHQDAGNSSDIWLNYEMYGEGFRT